MPPVCVAFHANYFLFICSFNRHMPVISKLLQGLLQLEPLLDEAIASYEWERCRMLAKVYTDATTSYGDATLLVLGDEAFEQCKVGTTVSNS
jgi:hypothetical protein